MATITLTVTAEDFDRLTYLSAEWHPDILKHPNRFDGAPAPLGFNKIYWCESYVETMLCQHYLGSVGVDCPKCDKPYVDDVEIFAGYLYTVCPYCDYTWERQA